MLDGLIIILCCQLAGELLVAFTGLPVPGPVAGMVLMLVGFMVKGGIPRSVAETGDGLIGHLSLLFVPAGVGVMVHAALIARDWLAISAALVASTLVCIGVTASVMHYLKAPRVGLPEPDL